MSFTDGEGRMNEVLEKFDERPRKLILTRRVAGYSNSMEEILAGFCCCFCFLGFLK